MTDPLTLLVAVLTLGLALVTAWLMRPRPPALHGERWFKAWLATLLRGEIEAAGGTPEQWGALVDRSVLFHPLAHPAENKLSDQPVCERPAREGEPALVDVLRGLPDRRSRWEHLFALDEIGRAARLGDPHDLGPPHQPSRWLGPAITWDKVAGAATDPSELIQALGRASAARWVIIGQAPAGAPAVGERLVQILGERAVRYEPTPPSPAALEAFRGTLAERRPGAPSHVEASAALVEALHALAGSPSDRLVLLAEGVAVHHVLDAMLASDALRDQVDAVVAVHAPIQGGSELDYPCDSEAVRRYLSRWFNHDDLDLEAAHLCPYFAVQWLSPDQEPPGAFGVALHQARFPSPADGPRISIEAVDLGPIAPDQGLSPDLVALALLSLVTCWVKARRP